MLVRPFDRLYVSLATFTFLGMSEKLMEGSFNQDYPFAKSLKESERDMEIKGHMQGSVYLLTMKFKPSNEGSKNRVRGQ